MMADSVLRVERNVERRTRRRGVVSTNSGLRYVSMRTESKSKQHLIFRRQVRNDGSCMHARGHSCHWLWSFLETDLSLSPSPFPNDGLTSASNPWDLFVETRSLRKSSKKSLQSKESNWQEKTKRFVCVCASTLHSWRFCKCSPHFPFSVSEPIFWIEEPSTLHSCLVVRVHWFIPRQFFSWILGQCVLWTNLWWTDEDKTVSGTNYFSNHSKNNNNKKKPNYFSNQDACFCQKLCRALSGGDCFHDCTFNIRVSERIITSRSSFGAPVVLRATGPLV